ncbi:hypothetical protein HZS61_001583 [Fusarium oxysporum f. sp. conglutinans]|uniref:NAD(P)-binding domain-containing protein n=1 Tax=Fusarium oxysporum f. sp. conglutinans TaxID=100902 RepID=A0A8H6H6L4_FUSOX|nr:hypothetical protein HZS61_001583 [Fusarium oxysporum f. sp. conglutinans]
MGIVAIPGGTGGIGRALVEAIIARGKHQVIILSRKPNDGLAKELGASIIVVDYSDADSLKDVLEENKVDTVVSALSSMPGQGTPPEVSLVRAAEASKVTRRLAERLPSTSVKVQTLTELAKTQLEWTQIYAGFLTDFFATPAHKTYMSPMIAVVDLVHDTAAVPGKGDTPVTFTHTFDLAKYTDRVLGFTEWDREYWIIGDKATWNEVLQAAEEGKGTKFKVTHDSVEDLERGVVTELPALTLALPHIPIPKDALLAFSAAFGLIFETGGTNFDDSVALNNRFPDIKPLKIKDAIRAAAKAIKN